ncbi:MAG: hypothetical protein HYY35_10755 [Deltaproteobacteria bacterium]|nr:hypothetical protein [Deltaproteobacteria bacterium]
MNLHLGETVRIFLKTLPFVIVRAGIYSAFGLAALAYAGAVLGLAALFAKVGGGAGGLMALVVVVLGLGGGWGLVGLARSWLLHVVKVGHVAVATAYLTAGELPAGESQYDVGKRLVLEQFVDVNLLFVLDGLVKGSTRAVNRQIENVSAWIPIPGIEGLAQWAQRVVAAAMNFVDETVLSYSLHKKQKNVWQSALEGVVLYAQSYQHVLANAVVMAIAGWASFGVIVLALGIFFWPISYSLGAGHGTLQSVVFLLPFLFGYVLKLSIVNPFVMISVLVTFYKHALGQPISAEWQARIERASDKFRELQQRARDFVAQPPGAAADDSLRPAPPPA